MAMIADAFISRFTDSLIKLVEQKVDLLLGVPGEIEKLQRTLRTVSKVLADAERRRIDDEAINDWLKELKDVMYDADDILDLCQIEAEKIGDREPFMASWENCICPGPPSTFLPTLWEQFLLPVLTCCQKTAITYDIGSRIKDLNDAFEEISKRKSQFHLALNSPGDGRRTSEISRQSSPIDGPDIVGSKIEEDLESLVNKLLTAQDRRENVLVFAIMGLGGIGKTTLAQKIFNDQRIEDIFQKNKMWVCVSQEFSEIELLKEIITAAGGVVPSGAKSRSLLELLVREQLQGKKFLLVLDDVWKTDVWDGLLQSPLQSGAVGSRVLITTRKEGVARQMNSVYCHHVEKLSLEDGWTLLCKKVALTGREIQNLKDIGMEIVKKCDGLPLAIKTIGGVLCMKNRQRSDWKGVLNNTTWSVTGLPEQVQAALFLSYEDLPSHLKQCFLYCSLFPENQTLLRFQLIRLWISEGFVAVQGSSSMEDVGKEYYTELIMRNLLIPDHKYYDRQACKMHDLLRSLAQFLTQGESTTFEKINKGINRSLGSMKLRRVSITDKEMTEALGDFTKQVSLRTLLVDGSPICKIDNLIHNLPRLRVLSLENTCISNLPDSLGCLAHLRYLSLAGSKIGLIPQTIGCLKNLLYLVLAECKSLVALPDSVVSLQSLTTLAVAETMLDGLPSGLGRLQHLCNLSLIVPPENKGFSTLEELGNLSQLRHLRLDKLERASSSTEARGAALLEKPELVQLKLHCTPQHTEEAIKKIKGVFEELCPPPCLEQLGINGYFSSEFPSWMTAVTSSSASNLSNLRRLNLERCKHFEWLPPLGLYSNLDYLSIYRAESITSIGPEFLHGGSCGGGNAGVYLFPKLEKLMFVRMPNWEEWVWENGVQAMPNLKTLVLSDCPKLGSLPDGLLHHATALTELRIKGCNSLRAVENLLSLKKLELERNPNLATVSYLPSLQVLEVKDCPAVRVVEKFGDLRRMVLDNCHMETLPEYISGVHVAELKSLVIHCSELLLKNICLMDGSPEWSKIKQFQRVSVYSHNESIYAHYVKNPFSIIKNLNAPTINS